MCACIGGLDRAHLHIMPMNKTANEKTIKESINLVLKKRKSGIASVEVDGYEFTTIHDINEIINGSKKDTYKISGKQLQFDDIQSNLDINNGLFHQGHWLQKVGTMFILKIQLMHHF